jgi:hypothetical protein
VTRRGATPEQLDAEFARLRDELRGQWQSVFPSRRGYLVLCRAKGGPLEGVRVRVSRGDFRAEVDVSCDWKVNAAHGPRSLVIRTSSKAHSSALSVIDGLNRRLIRRAQRAGMVMASLTAIGVFWSFAGTPNPVIAGMMLTIVTVVLFASCWRLASRIGEGIADRRRARVLAEIERDSSLQEGFRRWSSLRRELRVRRRVLERGSVGMPFRRSA